MLRDRYFGPISNRVRSLFIKHTHTGNPLVDSVAEHQATKPEAYWLYFHLVFYGTPVGFVMCCVQIYKNKGMQDAKWFLLMYTLATAYFSRKMVRLILILAPAAAICSGLAVAAFLEWAHAQLMGGGEEEAKAAEAKGEAAAKAEAVKTPASEKKASKKTKKTDEGHLSAQVPPRPAPFRRSAGLAGMCPPNAQPGCPTLGAPPAAPATQLHSLTHYCPRRTLST